MGEALVLTDDLYKDADTSTSRLAEEKGTLERVHESMCLTLAVAEGQNERMADELKEQDEAFKRMEAYYISSQSHHDGDMAHMKGQVELMKKQVKTAREEAEDMTGLADTRSKNIQGLKAKLHRQQKEDEEAKKQLATDVEKMKAMSKRIEELEAQGTEDRKQQAAKDEKIRLLEKESTEHDKEAEELGESLADEMAAKDELMKELADAKKKIKDLEGWEEVGLADRIDTATRDMGTQSEDSTANEAEEPVPEEEKQADDHKGEVATANAQTQTEASTGEEAESRTSEQQKQVEDLTKELADAHHENQDLTTKVGDLDKRFDEQSASYQQAVEEKKTAEAARQTAEDEKDHAAAKAAEALAAEQTKRSEWQSELNDLLSKQSIVDVVVTWANVTEAEYKALKITKDALEAKILEVEAAKTMADQSRDGAIQELSAWKGRHQQDVIDARVQAEKKAESEKAELREEAERRHQQVVDKMQQEAQEFEASKNREIQELQSLNITLTQQLGVLHAERDNALHSASFHEQRAREIKEQLGRAEEAIEKRQVRIRELEQAVSAARPPPPRRSGKASQEQNDKLVAAHEELKQELKSCETKLQQANVNRGAWAKNEEGKWVAKINTLKKKIQDLEGERDSCRANGQSYLKQAQDAKAECHEAQKELEEVKRQVQEMQAEKAKLETDLAQLHKKIKDAEKLVKKFGETINAYREGKKQALLLGKRNDSDEEGEGDEGGRSTKQQKTGEFDG